jgi:hypothetical protein
MPRLGNEVRLAAALEANLAFESPILLKLGLSMAGSFIRRCQTK